MELNLESNRKSPNLNRIGTIFLMGLPTPQHSKYPNIQLMNMNIIIEL